MGNWDHTLSRHERGYGYEWTKTRERVLQRDGYLCQPCARRGIPTQASQVDHIVPKSQDGTDDYENLQAICTPCHDAKSKEERTGGKQGMKYDDKGFPIW